MSSWNDVGAAFAASYDALCSGTHDVISDFLGHPGGRTLLDVGAGVGTFAGTLASRGWQVTATEPAVSMRSVAAQRFPDLPMLAEALPDLSFRDDVFDVVTANFVLNHVPDPRRAATELLRVAKPGGLLAASIWLRSPSQFWGSVFGLAGIIVPPGGKLPADLDFDRSAPGFTSMLRDAGWYGVRIREHSWDWVISPIALWQALQGGVASAGALYESLSAREQLAVAEAFDEVCQRFASGSMVRLPHTAAIAQLRSA